VQPPAGKTALQKIDYVRERRAAARVA